MYIPMPTIIHNAVNSHHSHGTHTLTHPSVSLRVFCLPSFSRAQFLSFISFPSAQLIRPQYTFVFISSSVLRRLGSVIAVLPSSYSPFTTYPNPTTRRYRLTTRTTYVHNILRSCSVINGIVGGGPLGRLVSKEVELLRGRRSPFEGERDHCGRSL